MINRDNLTRNNDNSLSGNSNNSYMDESNSNSFSNNSDNYIDLTEINSANTNIEFKSSKRKIDNNHRIIEENQTIESVESTNDPYKKIKRDNKKDYSQDLIIEIKSNNKANFLKKMTEIKLSAIDESRNHKQWWTYLYDLDLKEKSIYPKLQSPVFHILEDQKWEFLEIVIAHVTSSANAASHPYLESEIFKHALNSTVSAECIEEMRRYYFITGKKLPSDSEQVIILLNLAMTHSALSRLKYFLPKFTAPIKNFNNDIMNQEIDDLKLFLAETLLTDKRTGLKNLLITYLYPLAPHFLINSLNGYFNQFIKEEISLEKCEINLLTPLIYLLSRLDPSVKFMGKSNVLDDFFRNIFYENRSLLIPTLQMFLNESKLSGFIMGSLENIVRDTFITDDDELTQAMNPLINNMIELNLLKKSKKLIKVLYQYIAAAKSINKIEDLLSKIDIDYLLLTNQEISEKNLRYDEYDDAILVNFCFFYAMPERVALEGVDSLTNSQINPKWLKQEGNIFEFVVQLVLHDKNKFNYIQEYFAEHLDDMIRLRYQEAVSSIMVEQQIVQLRLNNAIENIQYRRQLKSSISNNNNNSNNNYGGNVSPTFFGSTPVMTMDNSISSQFTQNDTARPDYLTWY